MNRNYVTISTALVLMLAGALGAAEAKTQHVHCNISVTFADGVETNIDTDGKKETPSAALDQGLANCTTGRFFFQEEAEWIAQPAVTTCPAGTTNEYHIDGTQDQHRAVSIDEKTGDQLFNKITSGTLCINFSAFPFPFTTSEQFETIDGTGKYTGATGTGDFHSAGSYLAVGFKDGVFGGFGQITGTTDGTLMLPKHNEN